MPNLVYIPPNIFRNGTIKPGSQFRCFAMPGFDGQPIAETESLPLTRRTLTTEVSRHNFASVMTFSNRMQGGSGLAGIADYQNRHFHGWSVVAAVNAAGTEFWRADGCTQLYAGEAANPPTGPWRSTAAEADGAVADEATSIPVRGLLAGEVVPAATVVKVGFWRYLTVSAVTASGAGAATLLIDQPLRGGLIDGDTVTVPGDFMVMRPDPGQDPFGDYRFRRRGQWRMSFYEILESEVPGGFDNFVPAGS